MLVPSVLFSEDFESLVGRSRTAAKVEFPAADVSAFRVLQKEALDGEAAAQAKLPSLFSAHLRSVYGKLEKQGGLLFSLRRPAQGFDRSRSNYAVNIQEFFDGAAPDRRIRKFDFEVTSKNGDVFRISSLRYRPADRSLEVKRGQKTEWIALEDLSEIDYRFVKNALADEVFESSGDFLITSEDLRPAEGVAQEKYRRSFYHSETGELVEGSFVAASAKGVVRKIILENKGTHLLEHIAVEYQSFADQTLMRHPKDSLSEYRVAGFFAIQTLAPGERKELTLVLPDIVTARLDSIHTGEYEYTWIIPPGQNSLSEGRHHGVWVRVHRFTPYGERLTREYKSAGVPSVEWDHVAPVGADIRK